MTKQKSNDYEKPVVELTWSNWVIGLLKTILLALLFLYFLWYNENQSTTSLPTFMWIFVGIYGTLNVIDLWEGENLRQDRRKAVILGFVLGAVIGFLVMVILILAVDVNWFPNTPQAMWMLSVVIGITLGKIVADMTLMMGAEGSLFLKEKDQSAIAYGFMKSRYQLTFLIALVGVLLLIDGFFVNLAWYYQYLIPIGLLVPLALVIFRDLTEYQKKAQKEEGGFLKVYGIIPFIIEFAIGVIIYLLIVFATIMYDWVPESWLALGDQNWTILATLVAVAGMVLVHMILDKSTFAGAFRKWKKEADGGYYDLNQKEQLLLLEVVLILVFAFAGYYMLKGVEDIVKIGATWQTLLMIIIAMALFMVCLSMIQYYYAEYMRKVKGMQIQEARKYLYIIGFIYLGIIIGCSIAFAWNNALNLFNIISASVIIVIVGMVLEIMLVPSPNIVQNTDAIPKPTLCGIIFTILGLGLLGVGIYFVVWELDALTLTLLVSCIVGIIGGSLMAIYGIFMLIKNRKVERVEEGKDAGAVDYMYNLILPIVGVILGAVVLWLYPFDLTTWQTIVGLVVTIIGGLALIYGIYTLSSKGSRVKEETQEIKTKSKSKSKKDIMEYSKDGAKVSDVKVVKKGVKVSKTSGQIEYKFD